MTKELFLETLKNGLYDFPEAILADILYDYKERFEKGLASGKTNDEILEELGNPNDIVNNYRNSSLKKYDDAIIDVKYSHNYTQEDSSHTSANNTEDFSFIHEKSKNELRPNKSKPNLSNLILSLLIGFLAFIICGPFIFVTSIAVIGTLFALIIATIAIGFAGVATLCVKLGINVIGFSTVPAFIVDFPNSVIIFATLGGTLLLGFFALCFYYLAKFIFIGIKNLIVFITTRTTEVK